MKIAPSNVMFVMAFISRLRPFYFFFFLVIISSQGRITENLIGSSKPEIEIDHLKSTT